MLFWKEHTEADKCHVCNEPKYKINDGKGKKNPTKNIVVFSVETYTAKIIYV